MVDTMVSVEDSMRSSGEREDLKSSQSFPKASTPAASQSHVSCQRGYSGPFLPQFIFKINKARLSLLHTTDMFTKYPLLHGTGIKRLAQKITEREWGISPTASLDWLRPSRVRLQRPQTPPPHPHPQPHKCHNCRAERAPSAAQRPFPFTHY